MESRYFPCLSKTGAVTNFYYVKFVAGWSRKGEERKEKHEGRSYKSDHLTLYISLVFSLLSLSTVVANTPSQAV
jgi:hypothetical protein